MVRLVPSVLAALAVALAGCAGPQVVEDRRGDVVGRVFEFQTTGGDDRGDPGEWNVRLRGRAFWIMGGRPGSTKEYGAFNLDDKEARTLWKLIERAGIHKRAKRKIPRGKPGEILWMFAIERNDRMTIYEIWRADAIADDDLKTLAKYIRVLIRRYTKTRARL